MKTVATSTICFFSAMILLMLWYMFFIVEIPYASIGDASGQLWYQHSYWGLLGTALFNLFTAGFVLFVGAFAFLKGRQLSIKIEKTSTRLLVLSAINGAYGLYVLGSFIFVSCAC